MKYIVDNRYGKTNFANSIAYYTKIICNRIFYSILVLLSIFILILQKKDFKVCRNIRGFIFFVSKPEIFIVKITDSAIEKFNSAMVFFSQVNRNNKSLKKENLDLKIKLLELSTLEDENKELKNILNFVSKNYITKYTIKKINILSKNTFISRAKIVTKNDDDVEENDLVVDSNGNLVGRIINVENNSAEILLLTDTLSKLPAKLEKSKIKILVEGNESKNLKIDFFLGEKFNIKDGEMVVTSNDGSVLQDGIPIGRVAKDKNGIFMVKINTNLSKLGYVIILHFDKKFVD